MAEFNKRYTPLHVGTTIKSGYGCYPMLLFNEPYLIKSTADWDRLEALSHRFHGALWTLAMERRWSDAVDYCDLAKVLHLPGTLNYKDPEHIKPVRVIEQNSERFDIREIDRVLPEIPSVKVNPIAPASPLKTAAADDHPEKTIHRQDVKQISLSWRPDAFAVAKYYAKRLPELKQTRARQWRGCCPLHHGTKDSFVVRSATGLWYCFGDCQRGGSLFDLEMALTSVDFSRASRQVARILAGL